MVYRSFAALQMGGLTGTNLSALDALGNPLLLVTPTSVLGRGVLHPCIIEIRSDRAATGGRLTPKEKAKINHQQNANSGAIYRKKHNGRMQ